MINYKTWLKKPHWTKRESAFLLAGVYPKPPYFSISLSYAIQSKTLITPEQNKRIIQISGFFKKAIDDGDIDIDTIKHEKIYTENWYGESGHVYIVEFFFKPKDVINWAINQGLNDYDFFPAPFVDWYEKQQSPLVTQANHQSNSIQQSTVDCLIKEFSTSTPTLEQVAARYLGISKKEAYRKFNKKTLPFHAFRVTESQKSPLLVNVSDLAVYLERQALP